MQRFEFGARGGRGAGCEKRVGGIKEALKFWGTDFARPSGVNALMAPHDLFFFFPFF